jgi:glutamate-1-semialdehyde 2,1-aminomutase
VVRTTTAHGGRGLLPHDGELTRLLRTWLANRGIWEALAGAGPTVPVPATHAEVDRYLQAYAELLETLTRSAA